MVRLFGTDGIRGVANDDLSPELALKLGEAAGRFLGRGHGRIVVGMDTRRSGDMLEAALVAGICASGSSAVRAGIVPTPAVAFLTRELSADGGVVISASHNPAQYNGVKLFDRDGFKLPDEIEDEIEETLVSERAWQRPIGGSVGCAEALPDAAERYVAHVVTTVAGDLAGLRIAVDCGHGASSGATPAALQALGATVTSVNCDWDGMNINHECGSTNLGVLKELVRSGEFDLGIAHDGDADRVLAVDERGEEVDGDQIMAVCALDLLERGALAGGTVVATVMSNLGLETTLRAHGIGLVRTRVGDRYVLDQMRASGAVFGGEQSGHVIFLEHATTGDGLVTAVQLASIVKRSGKRVSELVSVMERYPQVLLNVRVADRGLLSGSAEVAAAVHAAERELDGEGRILVRTSGTEPLVRVMVEAADAAQAHAVAERVAEVVGRELG